VEHGLSLGGGKHEGVPREVKVDGVIVVAERGLVLWIGVENREQRHRDITRKLAALVEQNRYLFVGNVRYKDLVEQLLDVLERRAVDLQESLGFGGILRTHEVRSHSFGKRGFASTLGGDEHEVGADASSGVALVVELKAAFGLLLTD
tara:strand:- start:8913 stop:9356 length:444 start_codon:yes stop_codon:yes gene_type:complete